MKTQYKNMARITAAMGTASWLFLSTTAPGVAGVLAEDSGVVVTNTETIQVYTDASGKVDTKRVYEQLELTGKGSVSVENPVSTDELRNLDGFGAYEIREGSAFITTTVDGKKRYRSVSDYNGNLPLDVSISYFLDGEEVKPGDVVGEDGDLEVKYHVENVTGRLQEVTVPDGKGGSVSKEAEVVIPMVGSLTTTLPSNFTDVVSAQANMAGDGRGGTKLSFTMTLFPPIGQPFADFSYTAKISDGVVPKATISALPVNPLESPSFKVGAESYKGGADTGTKLTAGATEIDSNLLRLRDGAAELSAGLLKLYEGSGQLSEGLNNKAVPGSNELADGAVRLNDGATQLADGTTQLRDGATRLDDGANKLNDGATQISGGLATVNGKTPQLMGGLVQVRDGLQLIDDGLSKMYGQVDGARQQFRAGLDRLIAGIGSRGNPDTLLGGLNSLKAGIRNPDGLTACIADQRKCGAADVNQLLAGKLAQGATTIESKLLPAALGAYDYVVATAPLVGATCPARPSASSLPPLSAFAVPGSPCYAAAASAYGYGAETGTPLPDLSDGGLVVQSEAASAALTQVYQGLDARAIPGLVKLMCGLDNKSDAACATDKPGVLQGIALLDVGINSLIDGVLGGIGQPTDTREDKTLRGGINALQGGLGELVLGGEALIEGLSKLGTGADQLAGGTQQLADGSQQLAEGTTRLDDGATRLADGSGLLSGGMNELRDGLIDAADGSNQIRDGLKQASDGSPQIRDGATRLSDEGTKKLIEAGSGTALTFGERYALIDAGSKRAQAESMAFGAPDDAHGLTAYTYEIRGASGEGPRNFTRGAAALLLFGLGTGFAMYRRGLV